MFNFKTLLETLWPTDIDQDGDLSKLLDGLAEDYQSIYDQIQLIAHIRDPRRTNNLSDLEREYGIVPDSFLSDSIRRQMLAHIVYQRPTTASWEHLQNALINAGFEDAIVVENNPVVDPDDVDISDGIDSEFIVNGKTYTDQSPAYYLAAGSSIAFAGHSRAYVGYYLTIIKTLKTYTIPTEINAHWSWRYVFWVGSASSGWPSSPVVDALIVDEQRITQLKNLILKYKPAFTWCVLVDQLSTLLAGSSTGGHIFRSVDYGLTWSDLDQQYSQTSISALINIGNGICLAGTQSSGLILRSTDYGLTWSNLGQQASETSIRCFTYVGNGVCLAGSGSNGKIFRSIDYGLTWSEIQQLGSETQVYSLCFVGSGICLAGTYNSGKIFRSTDYGLTWSDLGQQYSESYIYCLLHIGNGVCLAGTGNSGLILRSIDYGLTWSSLGQQAGETVIRSFACTSRDKICFAGTSTHGKILKSIDRGLTWSDLGQQESETTIYSLVSR